MTLQKKLNKITKWEIATLIEEHHLYEPSRNGIYSKNHYRYNSLSEINYLTKTNTKQELIDMLTVAYDYDADTDQFIELSRSEMRF